MKDRLYPLLTYVIRNTYSFGVGKIIHEILKSLNLLSNPMASQNGVAVWSCKLTKEQFEKLEINLEHRRKIAAIYAKNIAPKILSSKLTRVIPDSTNLRFPVFVNNRVGLINFLKKQRIYVSDIWYDAPIAPRKYMPQTNYVNQCPNAEKVADTILNLPTHKNVSEDDAIQISQIINQWIKQ